LRKKHQRIIDKIVKEEPDASVESIIKKALKTYKINEL
jgi:Holliday junction resolvasome RuvABC DNA-binding subunit